jgi:hypothetical protein
MIRSTILVAILAILAGCGDSPPPDPVASVPVVASDPTPERPPAAPGLKNLDAAIAEAGREPAPTPDGGTFPFPDDAGGKALAKSLAPAALPPLPAAGPGGPRPRGLPSLTDPTAPLPTATPTPPRWPLPAGKPVRPVPLPDRVPADLGKKVPDLPPRGDLPVGPLTRTEGPDMSRPADLPILSSKPVPDRAPLTDPTGEFTAQSVISLVLPLRTGSTLFIPINLPDPFEHAADARPRTPVVEDPNRVLGDVPRPK